MSNRKIIQTLRRKLQEERNLCDQAMKAMEWQSVVISDLRKAIEHLERHGAFVRILRRILGR